MLDSSQNLLIVSAQSAADIYNGLTIGQSGST